MFNKNICKKIGYFDEQLKSGADYDFGVRAALLTRIKAIGKNLGYFLDEGKGLSTKTNGKKMIEDTVIGLRYGIYDCLYYHKILDARRYDISSIEYLGKRVPLKDLIPDYESLIWSRMRESILKGPKSYVLMEIDQYKRWYSSSR